MLRRLFMTLRRFKLGKFWGSESKISGRYRERRSSRAAWILKRKSLPCSSNPSAIRGASPAAQQHSEGPRLRDSLGKLQPRSEIDSITKPGTTPTVRDTYPREKCTHMARILSFPPRKSALGCCSIARDPGRMEALEEKEPSLSFLFER